MAERFTGSFTQQEPIPEEAIAAALGVMRSGRLHRYNVASGEEPEAAALERDFARMTGARYCLALASGGQAMAIALRAAGVRPGDRVLTNGFTLAPVPGAIAAVGAVPVFVEVTERLVIDLGDLEAKIASVGAKVLLLSLMRGHIGDMSALLRLCAEGGVTLIEDCAHTMGATWDGRPSGRFGLAGCFSTQTYKHANSGEGGLLISDDAEFMARATMLSGSYMFYGRHPAGPEPEIYERLRYETPNCSARMDNLRAAILRPQLATLGERVARWAALYRSVEVGLEGTPGLVLIARDAREGFVGSSIQFRLPGWEGPRIAALVARCAARGVELKWFGAAEPAGFTSRHDSWRYAPAQRLAQTDRILSTLIDMRLPLSFGLDDGRLIARIIREEVAAAAHAAA
ncbi:MAG: aminotransferase [Alphaproteobacteria bacterium HGW-Alphaproteobacteria-2]|nr:MAG: aminotransferase [Alphaproteobacteria bacterium HGW-Alphaproteobacteria-2]